MLFDDIILKKAPKFLEINLGAFYKNMFYLHFWWIFLFAFCQEAMAIRIEQFF